MKNHTITRRGYVYKYGPFYLGWIIKKIEPRPILYQDNTPYMTLIDETSLEHLVIGFTEKRVLDKLRRFLNDEQYKSIMRAGMKRKEGPDVAYICDGHGCDAHCGLTGFEHEYCHHTEDISHAANFKQVAPGKWMEDEEEKDVEFDN